MMIPVQEQLRACSLLFLYLSGFERELMSQSVVSQSVASVSRMYELLFYDVINRIRDGDKKGISISTSRTVSFFGVNNLEL